jgi:hypothetical protein
LIGDIPRPRRPDLHRETTRHGKPVWYVRVGKVQRILDVREYAGCRGQLERGKLALAWLNTALKGGNLSDAGKMTFEQAIEGGSPPPAQAMREAAE